DAVHRILALDPLDYYGMISSTKEAGLTMAQLKKRFTKLSLLIHPDKFNAEGLDRDPDVLLATQTVLNAFEVLKNVNLKHIYDTSRSAHEFHDRIWQHQQQEAQAAQQNADADAREQAKRAAAAAEAARQEAERKAEEDAEDAAAGVPPPSPGVPWFRVPPHRVAARQRDRQRAHKPKPGLDVNTFTAQDSAAGHRDQRRKEQAKKRAERQTGARKRLFASDPNANYYYGGDPTQPPAPNEPGEPRYNNRARPDRGNERMGKGKERKSRFTRVEAQKAARASANFEARAA
ncbi:J domain-containing protein, partial [bacterium]|nr:J domain-containing protein [bacterium]